MDCLSTTSSAVEPVVGDIDLASTSALDSGEESGDDDARVEKRLSD